MSRVVTALASVRRQCRGVPALLSTVATRVAVRARDWRVKIGMRLPRAPADSRELLDVALQGLNVGRDTKALVVARDGIIIDINRLASQLCGRLQEELIGKSVAELFSESGTPHSDAAIQRWETVLKTATGKPIPVEITRQPLAAQLPGVEVHAIRDLRDRREAAGERVRQMRTLQQREVELKAQNIRLDAALENMLQGLAMFDGEQRLVVCNSLYAKMYGLTPEQVKPGTTVREIFEYRLANGHYHVKDSEGFVDSWAGHFGPSSARIQELADGRIVSVMRRQTADGGRVVTHEDITDRQRLNTQLAEQNGRLREQEEKLQVKNLQLDAALNNMVQGLAMFDAELRIVVANDRYAQLYGLTPEQVKPGTSLRQIVAYRIANGDLPGRSVDDVMNGMLRRVAGDKVSHYTVTTEDGRYITVSSQPIATGWTVTTHHDITEQRRSDAKISHMALHDGLTDLPNRALLSERLEYALARVNRGEIVALHLLDLDHFKKVNDTLGHAAGDKLLMVAADRLRALVRETDTVARLGGDEFAILQVVTQPADATSLAERVIESVSAPYDVDGQQVVIGMSVGIAVGPADGVTPDQLMRNADLALYRAKGDGRGAFRFFEPAMDAQMQARRAMERDLRQALAAREFELYYQPVVNLQDNAISGFEALIRWHHPEKGMIPPANFIPVAEEIGLIVPLGEWAIRQACANAAAWPDDLTVAVNLSAVQFRSPGLVQVVVNALAAAGLPARRLELEITETVLMQNNAATLATLNQLRELGVKIAMDDFGTGYSSLSYLQSFPFDKIKIDRSFVKDITESVSSLNIVRAVAALAHGLGMVTTAEGVETKEQLDAIKSEGCTEMQGFFFSKAVPAHEIEKLLLAGRPDRGQQDTHAA